MAKVIAGVCDDCGVAAPHAAVHEGWHVQLETLLQRLPTVVGARTGPAPGSSLGSGAHGMKSGFGQGAYWQIPAEEYEVPPRSDGMDR